jgi:hypothetical protein
MSGGSRTVGCAAFLARVAWLAMGVGTVGACGRSGAASSQDAGCPSCPMEEGGSSDAGDIPFPMPSGGSCPASSPTSCTDCSGAEFCVAAGTACPQLACPPRAASSTFPLDADVGDGGALATISAQCAASSSRPLTAGSYTEPETGLTVHWPDGWTLTTAGQSETPATLTTPVTWVPTGSTTALQDHATFSISVVPYGNPDQVAEAVPERIAAAMQAGGAGSAVTLAGQPGAVWWQLVAPPQPECPAPCGIVASSPEFLDIGALVQFTMVDAGYGSGVEVDLTGSARADAQPAEVFCDIEAMILGVTLAP